MNAEITVKAREVYDCFKVYPVCEQAKLFADIAGTKTLTPATCQLIERLGYKFIQQENRDLPGAITGEGNNG